MKRESEEEEAESSSAAAQLTPGLATPVPPAPPAPQTQQQRRVNVPQPNRRLRRRRPLLLHLPEELLPTITSRLSLPDRASLATSCTHLRDRAWRPLCQCDEKKRKQNWQWQLRIQLRSAVQAQSLGRWLARQPCVTTLRLESVARNEDIHVALPAQPLASLQDLDISGLAYMQTQLTSILRHTSLTRLLIRGGDLSAAPGGGALGGLTKLECLDLRDTRLSPALLPRIGSLVGLTALNLGRVHAFGSYAPQLPRLPPGFSRLRALRSLVLRQNPGIGGLAPLGCMTALTELDLGACELYALPPAISRLTSLRRLNLAGNDYLGAASLAHLEPLGGSLTELNLAWWDGAQLPPALARLAALRDLNLTRRETSPLEGGAQHVLGLVRLTRLMLAGWSDEACAQLSATLRGVWHRTRETPCPNTWASIRH